MKNAVICVLVNKRTNDAPRLQQVLTDNGCIIKTRIGMHEVSEACSEDGLIILQVSGNEEKIKGLEQAINNLTDVRAKTMSLDF